VPPDNGRQYERTELAWARSALLLVAVGLLLVRNLPSGAEGALVLTGTAGAVALGLAVGGQRARRLSRRPTPAQAPPRQVAAVVVSVVVLGVISLVLVP
jgi:uncharacterized membrane protein YidH (DUF202 family)